MLLRLHECFEYLGLFDQQLERELLISCRSFCQSVALGRSILRLCGKVSLHRHILTPVLLPLPWSLFTFLVSVVAPDYRLLFEGFQLGVRDERDVMFVLPSLSQYDLS